MTDKDSTIKSLPILLKLIEDNRRKPRITAENLSVQVSLAILYDLMGYVERKKDNEMELFKQRVRASVRLICQ